MYNLDYIFILIFIVISISCFLAMIGITCIDRCCTNKYISIMERKKQEGIHHCLKKSKIKDKKKYKIQPEDISI